MKKVRKDKHYWIKLGRDAGECSSKPVVNLDDDWKNCIICGYDHQYINDLNEAWYLVKHLQRTLEQKEITQG